MTIKVVEPHVFSLKISHVLYFPTLHRNNTAEHAYLPLPAVRFERRVHAVPLTGNVTQIVSLKKYVFLDTELEERRDSFFCKEKKRRRSPSHVLQYQVQYGSVFR